MSSQRQKREKIKREKKREQQRPRRVSPLRILEELAFSEAGEAASTKHVQCALAARGLPNDGEFVKMLFSVLREKRTAEGRRKAKENLKSPFGSGR